MQQENCQHRNSHPGQNKGANMIFFLMIPSLLLLFFLSRCTPESCFEETNAYVKIMFYDTTGKADPPDSITLYGLGITDSLYRKDKNIQPALLPLDASDGNSVFIIKINGVTDTLTFNYSSYPHLISQECGYSFYHVIDTPLFTSNKISRIRLMNRNITTTNEENIRILY